MICDKVKECAEKTQHIPPSEGAKKDKRKKDAGKKQRSEDVYKYPLSKSPCGSEEYQKRCIAFLDVRSQAKCEENGKTYILDQSKKFPRYEIMKFHIDQGVITDPEASKVDKCDYVLLIKDPLKDKGGTAVLVELKGTDTRHALKQLQATLNQKELNPLWDSQRRVFGRIVAKSMPPRIQNTDAYMDVKEAFFARHGNMKIKEENMREEYDELEQWR